MRTARGGVDAPRIARKLTQNGKVIRAEPDKAASVAATEIVATKSTTQCLARALEQLPLMRIHESRLGGGESKASVRKSLQPADKGSMPHPAL